MGENKGQTIFLSVIGIATLLVAIIGATFAYFTTTMGNNKAVTGTVTTATISDVVLAGTEFKAENIMPGYVSADQTFTISSNSITGDATADYVCNISKSGTGVSTDFQYAVTTGTDGATYGEWKVLPDVATEVATGTLSKSSKSHTYKAKFQLVETNANQNTQQGQSYGAAITCSLTKVNGKPVAGE